MNINLRLFGRRRKYVEINPDEILLDSSNLPDYDKTQFEGRLEKPISKISLYSVGGVLVIIMAVFIAQAWKLQVANGETYRLRSERNLVRPIPLFAGRGVIYDRNGALLVWNSPSDVATSTRDAQYAVSVRQYATSTGLAHVLGYVQYPSKDANGFYYQEDFHGVDGVEKYYNERLQGRNGSRLVEVDATGEIISENIIRPPEQGDNITLSIDSRVESALYHNIRDIAERVGFTGGAGVIMDVRTGEIIALTSYPEFDPQIMSDKKDLKEVRALLNDKRLPFLDRAVDGLYTPGSIVKPYVALGVLEEKIVRADDVIVTNGSISIPNPYDSTKSTLFRDWKNHGPVDMRRAIAVSSDVYFYEVGGGYKGLKGLGILNIDKYLRLFGFGTSTLPSFAHGKAGTIPTPEWKKETFDEDWYVGDTYHTAIGQYGFQVTPIQIARAVSAIANGGFLLTPSILKGESLSPESRINVSENNLKVIREGMRLSTKEGTSIALNVPFVEIAGKSGTAELGVSKSKVNSWITGFWPYQNPKYAFAVILESGSVHNLIGAAAAMRQQLDWMHQNTPEYFQ